MELPDAPVFKSEHTSNKRGKKLRGTAPGFITAASKLPLKQIYCKMYMLRPHFDTTNLETFFNYSVCSF